MFMARPAKARTYAVERIRMNAGVAHQADAAGREFTDQRQIERLPVAEVLGVDERAPRRPRRAAGPGPPPALDPR